MLSRVWSNKDGPLAAAYEKLHLGPSPRACTSALDTAYLLDLLLGPNPLTKLCDSNLTSVGVAVFQAEIGAPTALFASNFGRAPEADLLFGATTLAYQGTVTRLRQESAAVDGDDQGETWLVTRTFKLPNEPVDNVLLSDLQTTAVSSAALASSLESSLTSCTAAGKRFQSGLRDGSGMMRSCSSLLKPKPVCLCLRVRVAKGSNFVFNNWQKLQCALDPLQYALTCSCALPHAMPELARQLLARINRSSAIPRALCHQTNSDALETIWGAALKTYGLNFLATALSLFLATMPKDPASWRYSGRNTVSRAVVGGSSELDSLRLLYPFYCLLESPTLAALPEIVDPDLSSTSPGQATASAPELKGEFQGEFQGERKGEWIEPEPILGVFSPPGSANSSAVSVGSLPCEELKELKEPKKDKPKDKTKEDGWTFNSASRTGSSGATANPQLCLPRTDTLTQRLRQFSCSNPVPVRGSERGSERGERPSRNELCLKVDEHVPAARLPVSPPQDSVLAQLKRQHSVVHLDEACGGGRSRGSRGSSGYARSESVLRLDGKTTLLPPIGAYCNSFCPDLAVQACPPSFEDALQTTMRQEALFLEKNVSTLVVNLDAKSIEHWTLKDDRLVKTRAEPKPLAPAASQIASLLNGTTPLKQAFDCRFNL